MFVLSSSLTSSQHNPPTASGFDGAQEQTFGKDHESTSRAVHRRWVFAGGLSFRPLSVALRQTLATSLAGLHKRHAHILMEHLSLRSHNVSLSQSATPVTPSRPPFRYTCSAEQPDGWQAGRSSAAFHSRCAKSLAGFSLTSSLSLAWGSDRRNTLKQRFQREKLLVEFVLWRNEVDQHW
jgi:hypothetical protein